MRGSADVKVTTSTNGVTVEELPGYEGYAFVVGFPPGGAKPNGFYVSAAEGAAPVTATFIRRLPLDKLLKIASEARVGEVAGEPETRIEGRRYGGGDEHAVQVAEVYRWAVEHNIPPRSAIATRWARSEATAGRWIAEARKKGVLPPHGG